MALRKTRGKGQTVIVDDVGGRIFLIRIYAFDECCLAEEEADATELVQVIPQLVVGKNCEIGCDEVEVSPGLQMLAEEIGYTSPRVIVSNS